MEAFNFNWEQYALERFMLPVDYKTVEQDFDRVMNMLPHDEDENMKEIYMDCLRAGIDEKEDSNDYVHMQGLASYIDDLREGFKYLYGQYPENLTEKDLEGVTVEDIKAKAELCVEDEADA